MLACKIFEVTGLYCPGCGGTRMLIALLNLDFLYALKCNAWCILCIPSYVMSSRICRCKRDCTIATGLFILSFVLFTILRNTDIFKPFLCP